MRAWSLNVFPDSKLRRSSGAARRDARERTVGPARQLVLATLRQRRDLLFLTGFALMGAAPTFVAGLAIARAVDDGFLAGRPARGFAWLGVLAAAVLVGAVGSRMTYLGVARVAEPLRDRLVHVVVEGALQRSTAPGTTRDTGAVARLTKHVETVRETVAGLLLLVLSFAAAVVAALVGMATLVPVALPLVLVPLLVSLVAFAASLPAVTRQQRRLLVADESLAEQSTSAAEGIRDVVACGGEATVAATLEQCIDEQVAAERGMARLTAVREVIVSVGGRVPVILLLLLAPWLLGRGISAGALIGTLTYLMQGLEPAVSSVVDGVGAPLAQLTMTLRRIDEIAASPGAGPGSGGTGATNRSGSGWSGSSREAGEGASGNASFGDVTPRDAGLVLCDVTFRYRAAAEPVVNRLSLDVADGDHVAVVGPSGAGKSTLAALLVGLLSPQAGTVRHGGMSPADAPPSTRVLIPQEAYVFRGTLGENLRYYHPTAPADALDAAVAALAMEELVERLGGCDGELRPSLLSAGERQLVALARAYLSPARLIILDEATCHLDPSAEAVAERAFADRDGTLIVVAHRISSAARAGQVLLMDGPRTAQGRHQDLVEGSSAYGSLVGHWEAEPALVNKAIN